MKTVLIVAVGDINAIALANSKNLSAHWRLVTSAEDLLIHSPHLADLYFCETARQLPNFYSIVNAAKRLGFNVPPPLAEWGCHSATLSGAFKLLEGVHGINGFTVFAKQGDIGVYLDGVLVMHRREDGMLRVAKKGEFLQCQS